MTWERGCWKNCEVGRVTTTAHTVHEGEIAHHQNLFSAARERLEDCRFQCLDTFRFPDPVPLAKVERPLTFFWTKLNFPGLGQSSALATETSKGASFWGKRPRLSLHWDVPSWVRQHEHLSPPFFSFFLFLPFTISFFHALLGDFLGALGWRVVGAGHPWQPCVTCVSFPFYSQPLPSP